MVEAHMNKEEEEEKKWEDLRDNDDLSIFRDVLHHEDNDDNNNTDDDKDFQRDLDILRSRLDQIQKYLSDDSIEETSNRMITPCMEQEPQFVKPQQQKQEQRKQRSRSTTVWVRCLDLPLILVMTTWLLSLGCCIIYEHFYEPLFDRAERTDTDLLQEYTYYERHCNQYDVTTLQANDLLLPEHHGVDHMLQHGAAVIPSVLSNQTVQELRNYIMQRNAAVSDSEAYPVSQGAYRISYGIDATEHPTVTRALKEVAEHPMLRPLLQGLLGDNDPAVAEITAITSWAGAISQVWHPDTKSDGNALKFARTYSHSYSLFLPLQDTTERMGATDLCPGTHYCANDLEAVCEANKIGLHLAGPQGQYFPAGHGALINQHVWHRGSAHTDPNAPHRVVFIVSFLARPRVNLNDARQLSRGTYFHQKWNMWGHTLRDLQDASSMRLPFSVLRALSLWKPSSRNWGYDLVTAVYMRFSNGQLEDEDLPSRFLPRLEQLGFPTFLQGRLLSYKVSQKMRWQVFLKETLENTLHFVSKVNLWTHGVYGLLLLIVAILHSQPRIIPKTIFRWLCTHAVLVLVAGGLLLRIRQSQWGQDVLNGRYLMRPFPPVTLQQQPKSEDSSVLLPTTLPQRSDVLLGTRYDAPFLGSYDQWLDFHPGNIHLRKWVMEYADFYKRNRNSVLWLPFMQSQRKELEKGRFLLQDYRTGDWRILNESQKSEVVHRELQVHAYRVLQDLQKSVAWMMADLRFGFECRDGSRLCNESQESLRRWEDTLFQLTQVSAEINSMKTVPQQKPLLKVVSFLPSFVTRPRLHKKSIVSLQSVHADVLEVGSLVWSLDKDGAWYPGTVLKRQPASHYKVAFNDGIVQNNVPSSQLRKQEPMTQGDKVMGCFSDGLEDCYPGTIERVWPSGGAMIVFDDGDVEWHMTPDRYYKEPFAYAWEYYA